ncbi:hypothetical protein FLP10_09580 [Agromyces intestinalis]|uniref:Cytochrome C biogenesis protein transmembrane domain-containing protein n=2 Tax=Agromyces intestinalis TaxID=2592652 RepID=A0A5C1YKT0_9MICO|nr:hypothetical protein FLP10_09580 [Agromyces intestinalis]
MEAVDSSPRPRAAPFIDGHFPRRPIPIVLLSILGGFALSALWSYQFVDSVIGDNVANYLLGHDAKATPIEGAVAGIVFALVSGLAGTFTACNVAVFGAVAPCLGPGVASRKALVLGTLRALAWLAVGMLVISVSYGVLVGWIGVNLPQFSTAPPEPGQMPPVLVQSMVVFGVVGIAMIYLGLTVVGVTPDPLAAVAKRFPQVHTVLLGMLIGGFLVGRPYPLFRQLFRNAAEIGSPLYAAAVFSLQSLGNIALMAVIALTLALILPKRVFNWFRVDPTRANTFTAASLLTLGVFTVLYWDLRLLATFGVIPWYPIAPWV